MKKYIPYYYEGKKMIIDSYIILDKQICFTEGYDLFDTEINSSIMERIINVNKNLDDYLIFNDVNKEFYNTFSHFESLGSIKIFLYTEIYSQKETEIIMHVDCSSNTKLWLNGECKSIHNSFRASDFYIKAKLHKGKNILLIEKYAPEKSDVFIIQISGYKWEMSNNFKALSNLGADIKFDELILINKGSGFIYDSCYEFMYLLNNKKTYDTAFNIKVLDNNNKVLQSKAGEVNKKIIIDLENIRTKLPDNMYHITFLCEFINCKKEKLIKKHKIIINDFKDKVNEVKNKASEIIDRLTGDQYIQVKGRMWFQEKSEKKPDLVDFYDLVNENYNFINCLIQDEYNKNYLFEEGGHEFFIFSNLDNSFVKIHSRIPENYDDSKHYPVICCLMSGDNECFSTLIDIKSIPEPILLFDLSGRGYTGGSYIGEASIIEIIEWIKNHYSIDKDRIYLIGQSNGGLAAYALAQNHPNIPAAIFPLISYPDLQTIKNISNIPTYQFVCSKDYIFYNRENEVKSKLKKYANYFQYNFDGIIHSHFKPYISHRIIIKNLLASKRNKYPAKVFFKTQRNRHLESYYLKLHGINPKYNIAKVSGEIVDEKHINVKVSGTNGLTIEIPPVIDRKDFFINVNNTIFEFVDYYEQIVILNRKRLWELIDSEPNINYRKGTGLLDVYLYNTRIIIPNNPSGELLKAAESLSKRVSSEHDTMIDVSYPIFESNKTPEDLFLNNLIIIDFNITNNLVNQIFKNLYVKYDEYGYEYNGEKYNGNYVIMQIIANPYNNALSILVISTNSETLLSEHILLKKVIIPTYSSGLHEYWNNEVLVFRNGSYEVLI